VELNSEVKALQEQWAKQNQVFLGAVVADSVHLWTKKPIENIEELKGMKVGASGSLSLWAAGIGMVPVQGDFSTHYNNVRTGVYDSLLAFTTGTYPIKLHEVAPYLIRVDLGATSIGAVTINKSLYDSMPPEVQKVLQETGAEYSQRLAAMLTKLSVEFQEKMKNEGAKIIDLQQAERQKWASTMPNIAQEWVKRNTERGLPAAEVLKAYLGKIRGAGQEPLRQWDKN
jgi:TRAP-type transport system periplasmic protein